MSTKNAFFIDGKWLPALQHKTMTVINPATEQPLSTFALGTATEVDAAVNAAKAAFPRFARTHKKERIELLQSVLHQFDARSAELAEAITAEMGAPLSFSHDKQVPLGRSHLATMIDVLSDYDFIQPCSTGLIQREPIGVCGFITPWNWPLNQITCKVAPALAAGCTMVLKPSELTPSNAMIFSEILADAGVPAGVFNLVNGSGDEVGTAMTRHPDIDCISFTGSTRAGKAVAINSADSVKKVIQELGGKSANIILPGCDLAHTVHHSVIQCFLNSGQTCTSPTRLLVPAAELDTVLAIARNTAQSIRVGDPLEASSQLGPLVSQQQFERVQDYINSGYSEGARCLIGGTGRPDHLTTGYYVKPTIFYNVDNHMRLAQDEIFGPVLSIITYQSIDEAIDIANDTRYGLAAYVHGDPDTAEAVALRLRAGRIQINFADKDRFLPAGGYKQSGNGRECGRIGFEELLEIKAITSTTPNTE